MAEIIVTEAQEARFNAFLRLDPETGCLLFSGSRSKQGYGHFRVGKTVEKAHRVAWVLAGGLITEEKPHVLHNCPSGDNPACCNPEHLWTGTNTENSEDKARKFRGKKSKCGLPQGVWPRESGRFRACVYFRKQRFHLGTFDSAEEAGQAVLDLKTSLWNKPFMAGSPPAFPAV